MEIGKYIIYSLPLRADDTPLAWNSRDMARGMKALTEKYGLPGTWLPRYDALCDPEYIGLCKSLGKDQELGIWLEITSSHCAKAGIPFKIEQGEEWFWAKYCLTLGYPQKERELLIDILMDKFRSLFGYFPKTVSMWMLDSFSARYLEEKYKVKAIGLCRNQFGIDGYTMWGAWPNLPFFPRRDYIWQPARTKRESLKALVYPIITEDLTSNYGNEKGIWSTEVAIIQQRNLSASVVEDYINKLTTHNLDEKPVGLASFVAENGWDWKMVAPGYEKQISFLARLHKTGRAKCVTVSEFAEKYAGKFSPPSPSQVLFQPEGWGSDLKDSACVTACTPFYRARARFDNDSAGLRLTDLRAYDAKLQDPYQEARATEKFGRWIIPYLLDSSRFRLDRKDDNPVVDVAANKPMHFSVGVPGNACPGKGRLTRKSSRVFSWIEKAFRAEWEFKDEEIIITAKPFKKNGVAVLRLICNPDVLKLGIVLGKKIILLKDLKPGRYSSQKFVLVNLEPDAGRAAAEITGAPKSRVLVAGWSPSASGSVLSIYLSSSNVLSLRLAPCIAR